MFIVCEVFGHLLEESKKKETCAFDYINKQRNSIEF